MREGLQDEFNRLQPLHHRASSESNVGEEGSEVQLGSCSSHIVSSNTGTAMKMLGLLHVLLGKFSYLFTMALTLNVEKKYFKDLLVQLGSVYRNDALFIKQVGCK